MPKKELTLEDLEPQYQAFCENVKAVKQNTYWRTAFNKVHKEENIWKKNSYGKENK